MPRKNAQKYKLNLIVRKRNVLYIVSHNLALGLFSSITHLLTLHFTKRIRNQEKVEHWTNKWMESV